MLQSGSPHMRATASALTQAAAIAIDGPIRGKTAHKKIPKLANDRDTNVVGGGCGGAAAATAVVGSAFDEENQSLPGAALARSVDRGYSAEPPSCLHCTAARARETGQGTLHAPIESPL